MLKGVVIAGTRSGCGKSSVSLGLMRALARRGVDVRPFKAGPDFIDPGHHQRAATVDGAPVAKSHNLDGWMLGHEGAKSIFARYAAGGSAAVIEGVMGLHDGFSPVSDEGSTAELSRLLDLPVVLVVDARSMARSAAAMVSGYAHFDPDVQLLGVILNNVGSESHGDILRRAIEPTGIPVLGCLGRSDDVELPSRHLGLVTASEGEQAVYDRLADWLEQGVDVTGLLETLPECEPKDVLPDPEPVGDVRIGVARDEAFCFYYHENLRLLRACGAELVEFSPMRDKRLPEDLDGLYLGGGYPEVYAFELSQNTGMRRQVGAYCESGRPVYAECGGFLYLLETLEGPHGRRFNMCGTFPFRSAMNKRFAALGYRRIQTLIDSPLGPVGTAFRGHEFHYSSLESEPDTDTHRAAYMVEKRKGPGFRPEGWISANTLASYIHIHFGSNPELARNFVAACAG